MEDNQWLVEIVDLIKAEVVNARQKRESKKLYGSQILQDPDFQYWNNLNGWYGELPAHPELYEKDDWEQDNKPVYRVLEEIYGLMVKYDRESSVAARAIEAAIGVSSKIRRGYAIWQANEYGYRVEVWNCTDPSDIKMVDEYWAGNSKFESTTYVNPEDGLPIEILREYARQTAEEMLEELGLIGSVEESEDLLDDYNAFGEKNE